MTMAVASMVKRVLWASQGFRLKDVSLCGVLVLPYSKSHG